MIDAVDILACRLCAGDVLSVLNLGVSPLANEYWDEPGCGELFPLRVMRCQACGHYQLSISVSPDRLFADYAYESGLTETFRSHLKSLAETCEERFAPLDILEIGCNDGSLLASFQSPPERLTGIEPCSRLAKIASNKTQATIINGYWPTQLGKQFDLILALNVFAHVPDIRGSFVAARRALTPNGVFVFEVQYLPAQSINGLVGNVYHEHLDYHTLTSLVPFLTSCGLTLFDAEEIDTYGGSIRCFASKEAPESSHQPHVSASSETLLADEAETYYRAEWRLQNAAEVVKRAIQSTEGDLYGYGCPAKATTLLAISGQAHRFKAIFDDAPAKQGKYSPHGIPLLPGSDLMSINPPSVFLFSANFVNEIKSRYPDYAGRWIVV